MMHTLCAKSMWRKEEAKVKRLYLILSLLFVISKASAHFFKNRVYKQMSSLIVMVLDSCFSLSYFLFYSEIFFLYFHPMLPSSFPYHLYSANRSPQCPPAFFLLYVLADYLDTRHGSCSSCSFFLICIFFSWFICFIVIRGQRSMMLWAHIRKVTVTHITTLTEATVDMG